ncbi:type I pullulanase [Fictibacillus phosphorivorans]|uniref:type I pullulanase n=1 Tax=Fictibacillus phosphorivorans TaxID=1221500 RepID=UPI00203DA54B|nr:type I pullulanase [Fictibacillus phosphorivorans]MCM3717992.1 type I pullulanase [Fictibacillus phosphorivorans]MCM3775441.1 type I pullulanase [Fictibacillus phosphorivorans]
MENVETIAYIDDFSLITIVAKKPFSIIPSFGLLQADGIIHSLILLKQENYHNKYIYKCKSPIQIVMGKGYWIKINEDQIPLKIGSIVRTEQFDALFFEDGPLGALYSPGSTVFRVWSPVAVEMRLKYKRVGEIGFSEASMERTEKGVWQFTLKGDHHLTEYMYKANVNHEWVETTDPYARSVTINGERSVVIDLQKTDPDQWHRSEKRMNLRSKTDSIIYELHVRDFTIHPDSGVRHKGKYLGITERNTKTSTGMMTGLDYLTSLGITHVQLMPVADFGSVDETKPDSQYNWGYDPVHFFAPEGSYATDPSHPISRIQELKTLIRTLQDNGLSVILDVVFNHVYILEESSFEKLVPGYYFRYDAGGNPVNGTGVGNDTASERKMVRKFIIDALLYWLNEYKVDGFRFDLMGIHDVETMNMAAQKLKSLNPGIFLLGEGWDLNTNLEPDKRATLASAKALPDYSFFNDSFRDSVKGSIFTDGSAGFINGNQDDSMKDKILKSVKGYSGTDDKFSSPKQSINYTECHDNHTLYDLLKIRHPDENEWQRKRRQQLALAFTLFSRGVPFIHSGQEFYRTKHGAENSYNMPDRINALNWHDCEKNKKDVKYFQELIKIRNEQPIFREEESRIKQLHGLPEGVFGVEINHSLTDKKVRDFHWAKVLLIFNQTVNAVEIPIISGSWRIAIEDGERTIKKLDSSTYVIHPLSFSLIVHDEI